MKKLNFLAAVCCMAAVFAACEKNEPNDNGNGSNTGNYNANGHEYVDLGLPSGLKWATCNVGAAWPEEYGNLYAWGETTPNDSYDWGSYKWATATSVPELMAWFLETLTKYNTDANYGTVDNKTVLELADDAARANWGGAWRIPTDAEWTELRDNCEWTWTNDYNGIGVAGRIVTGPNGNAIFLPAAGYQSFVYWNYGGDYGYYWSSSLDTDSPGNAWGVSFNLNFVGRSHDGRCDGRSVRPVLGE